MKLNNDSSPPEQLYKMDQPRPQERLLMPEAVGKRAIGGGRHSLQVIGQNVEAHLGSHLVEGPGQEMGGAHPGFEGAERVFDGLSPHPHGLGHAVEPGLHPVEHVLILPALDDPPLGRRAPGLRGQVKQALRWR